MTTSRETIEQKPIIALREFFSAKSQRPVSMPEMSEFWKSCSEQEKNDLREAIKQWDGDSEFVKAA